jgi:DNA-binding response OmpR family regulator
VNAAISNGIAISSAVPRYVRPLTGRSIEPGRGRLGTGGGRSAAIYRGYSREGRSAAPTPGGETPVPDSSTILLVDDEDSVQKVLSYPLERDGFRVLAARDGEEALAKFAAEPVDLVVLDLMLPKLDGLEVCKRLRAQSTVPIIMLTARDDELDKVLGLELGADDYITKPFSIREFRSRVRALLRRASLPSQLDQRRQDAIEVDGLRIDPARRSVEANGRPIQLTYVEFELLRTLAANPGRVFSRRRLLESLWGDSAYREPRTIDVHVRHLREKLERDPSEPEFILTVRGAGYRFRDT